jgi:hypothetical protein
MPTLQTYGIRDTLLGLTQDVLGAIDGDEVSSIGDTVESRQVAQIIKRVYLEMTSTGGLPEDYRVFSFEATGPGTPVIMILPTFIDDVLWVKYNKVTEVDGDPEFSSVQYLSPERFFDKTSGFKPSSTNVSSVEVTHDTGDDIIYYYETDRPPAYWTSYDDRHVIFDAYDSGVESNLQSSKAKGYGRYIKTFRMEDAFVPELDDNQYPILLNDAIATAFVELKQTQNMKAERKARNSLISSQRKKHALPGRVDPLSRAPNFGRN